LPKRHGRNEDPVGKRAKAAKVAKTKATKEAKVADKVADKQRQEADAENAKEKLADMEIDESFAQAQEAQQCIRRQSDMEIMTQSDDSEGRSVNNVESSNKVSEAAADETQQLRKKLGPKVSFD
jgi:membrane protein involved in colicin uptake